MTDHFIDLIREVAAEGCPVEIRDRSENQSDKIPAMTREQVSRFIKNCASALAH
jgi:hypothetical protein